MNHNDASSASKLLESVLEDMNNIMRENDLNSYQHQHYGYSIANGNNNCLDLTPDKKFEYMLEELQKCLQETADTRNVMQNLSSDKKEFVRSLVRTDYETNHMGHNFKVDLMNENSKLKLDISFLQRDKQNLMNKIMDLNNRVKELEEENRRLSNDVGYFRGIESNYCIPPIENYEDAIMENAESPFAGDSPITTSTPSKSNHENGIPDVPPHANSASRQELIKRKAMEEIMREQSQTAKSNSWSELRVHKVNLPRENDVDLLTMTPPTHRKSSETGPDRSRSFGKGDTESDLRQRMRQIDQKRNSRGALEYHSNYDLSSQPPPILEHPECGQEPAAGHFTRNHPLRMTAAPRLVAGADAMPVKNKQVDDFRMWTRDHVCAFLHQIGLGMYANNCRRWLHEGGQQLINASRKEIEKELNITNKLHLKKLLIHVRRLTSMHVSSATYFSLARPGLQIASSFSIRLWLDDIGLLQYMNLFNINGVDGYMLDQLTVEDVHQMKITSELHVCSIKRGIQYLRAINYDLSLSIRRPDESTFVSQESNGDVDGEETMVVKATPGQVCRWSQHQVMEWLRQIELPEYASNLRGSGVHGALMILEDRFTANTLASVLNISSNKSLLRRHLQAKFSELIGPVVSNRKKASQDIEPGSPNMITNNQPLSANSKMKFHRRKSFFSSMMKRRNHHGPGSQDAGEEMLVPYMSTVAQQNIDLMLNTPEMLPNNELEQDTTNQSQHSIPSLINQT